VIAGFHCSEPQARGKGKPWRALTMGRRTGDGIVTNLPFVAVSMKIFARLISLLKTAFDFFA
jgi:hypothetical protein